LLRLAVQENLVPGETFAEKLRNMENYGFEGVEISYGQCPQKMEEAKQTLPSSKIRFSTVCGTPSGLLGPDRKTRAQTMQGVKDLLKMCAELDGVGVICAPIFGGTTDNRSLPVDRDAYDRLMEKLAEKT